MKKGLLFSLLTAIISGFSVYTNSKFVTHADPLVFAFLRNLLVGLILSIIAFKSLPKFKSLNRRQWLNLLVIGLLGGGIPFALFFTGLKQIGAVDANLINKSIFLWVALLAVPFLNEKINFATGIGYGILVYAIYLGSGNFKLLPNQGTFLVILATLFWSVEYVLAKFALKTISVGLVTVSRMIFGLPWLFMAILFTGKSGLLGSTIFTNLFPLIVSSIFLSGYMLTWYQALSYAPAISVTAILALAPLITLLVQSITTGKSIVPILNINTVLIIAAIGLITLSTKLIQVIKSRLYGV
jgi:drug/metabolite transporter (DMT)-like permease